ncbi:ribonuclease HII [Rubrimonas cliftonensis]|uniref:Ribonuclease HII n=1 Tax=Rubrimonas cliftonensis TaxID=89524 RepID=A0A1H3VK10_9RHOB|nr:ribonuclease HII [Rubrimonas cliftonensis]SDZ74584.1 RNase HII [Rubrimonas cliftonensis]
MARGAGPDFSLETAARDVLGRAADLCGVDEAGRGPWAGPVAAAAVILDPRLPPERLPEGMDDSKRMTPRARARVAAELRALEAEGRAAIGIGWAEVAEIDALRIVAACDRAMARAVAALPLRPALALVDGLRAPSLGCPAEAVVRGDGRSLSIAAASVVAKVARDALMERLAADWPGYGWETNRGYGAAAHRAGLLALGLTPHHRLSFRPVHNIWCARGLNYGK